jgi:hypothetical protein
MTTPDELREQVVAGFAASIDVRPYGRDFLLGLPQTFEDGTLLSVLVTNIGGQVEVTDRGLTAEQLSLVGVDITRGVAQSSWEAVRTSGHTLPAMGAESWEISAAGGWEQLSHLVQVVADTALRAEGLRVLTRQVRHRTFSESVVVRLAEARLPVVPRAPMSGRNGSARLVTCKVDVESGFYVQALAGRDSEARLQAFDHGFALFSTAVPDQRRRIAVLQDAPWPAWQVNDLRDVATVLTGDEFPGRLQELTSRVDY